MPRKSDEGKYRKKLTWQENWDCPIKEGNDVACNKRKADAPISPDATGGVIFPRSNE